MWNAVKNTTLGAITSIIHFDCVGGGDCPQRTDLSIDNNTKYELTLDATVPCQRECNHKGEFQQHFVKLSLIEPSFDVYVDYLKQKKKYKRHYWPK